MTGRKVRFAVLGCGRISGNHSDVTKDKLDLMIKTCRDKGVLLGGIFQRRTGKTCIETRNAIREGKLGGIECAASVYPGQNTAFTIHGEKGTVAIGEDGFYQ